MLSPGESARDILGYDQTAETVLEGFLNPEPLAAATDAPLAISGNDVMQGDADRSESCALDTACTEELEDHFRECVHGCVGACEIRCRQRSEERRVGKRGRSRTPP